MSDIDLGEVRVTVFSVMGITVSAVVPVQLTDRHLHLAFSGTFETGEQFLSFRKPKGVKKYLKPYVESASFGSDSHGDYVEVKARTVSAVRFRIYTELAVEFANAVNERVRMARRSAQGVSHNKPRAMASPRYARPKHSKAPQVRRKTRAESGRIPIWIILMLGLILVILALKYTLGF